MSWLLKKLFFLWIYNSCVQLSQSLFLVAVFSNDLTNLKIFFCLIKLLPNGRDIPEICRTICWPPVLYVIGWTCQTVPKFCPTFRPHEWILKTFKLRIYHYNTPACPPRTLVVWPWNELKRKRQESDTVKTIGMLGRCQDNVCLESNSTQHCHMAMSNAPNIWSSGACWVKYRALPHVPQWQTNLKMGWISLLEIGILAQNCLLWRLQPNAWVWLARTHAMAKTLVVVVPFGAKLAVFHKW